MVAELWSEIAQDKFIRNKEWFCAQERKDVNLNKNSFGCFFFLAAGGATRDGDFLLSEAELIRFGSDVAYLDIS
jgi:hypothetical protein